ncbi:MAG: PDZ domain-containing protein [Alphaproteobacteria bacterium]|nr:PDZ domain-containing protein [Alphaproteobacteria bacterium]
MKRACVRLGLMGLLLTLLQPGGGPAVADDVGFTSLFITLSRIDTQYVDPSRVDLPGMYEAAMRAAEQVVPELIFEGDPGTARSSSARAPSAAASRWGPWAASRTWPSPCARLIDALNAVLPVDADTRAVEYALSNGVLQTLDPHSILLTPEDLAPMQSDHEGSFGGLGISIRVLDRRLTVTCPLPGTPAEAAGLQSGDIITKIGTVSTTNMPIDEAVRRMRGPVGEPITISINRGEDPEKDVRIVRDVISLQHLEGLYLGDGVAYIVLRRFYRGAARDLVATLDQLEARSGEPIEGLVFDLRSNPGGLLTEAEEISDLFLSKGDIVSVVGAEEDKPEVTWATRRDTLDTLRLAVLVGPDSASASEIVAGALQGHDRAVVLGARSFGKGSVQNLWPLPGEAGLKMTIAEYLTAGQRSIQATGVHPHVELRPSWVSEDSANLYFQDAAFREEEMERALRSRFPAPDDPGPLVLTYAEDRLSPDAPPRDRFDCRGIEDMRRDNQVLMAQALLAASDSPEVAEMLRQGKGALEATAAPLHARLVEQIEAMGYSWAPGPVPEQPKLRVEHSIEGGVLQAGEEGRLTVTVTNEGSETVPQLRGMLRSEQRALGGRELLFGTLEPGESATYVLKVEITPDIFSMVEEVKLQLFAAGEHAVQELPLRVEVVEQPVPKFGMSVSLIDDGREGTRGNGDGLAQPGEVLQVAVSVHNLGDAPTGDRWLADWWERVNADRPEAQRGAKEGACYVTLYETSGRAINFPDRGGGGSCSGWDPGMEFTDSLMPGEVRRMRFTMEIPGPLMVDTPSGGSAPATAETPVRLQVTVRDQALWESASAELTLWESESPVEVREERRRFSTLGEVEVRSAASAEAAPIARVEGPLEAVAYVGGFWRVELPWGVPGFIAEADLEKSRDKGEPRVEEVLAQRPPLVDLAALPKLVTDADSLELKGKVWDAEGVDHVLVFVNNRKVRVLKPDAEHVESLDLDLSVPLEPGINSVQLVARDAGRSEVARYVSVYREE